MLLGCNSLLPIENKMGWKRITGSCTSEVRYQYKKKGVMTIKLYNQGRRTTQSERNLDRDGVGGARDEWAAKND
jgi:hypothetical protein